MKTITLIASHTVDHIDQIPTISLPKGLPSQDIILSPILGEFDLCELRSRRCTVFLDAQGYIRAPQGRNELNWHCDLQGLDNVVALKVNRREFQHVHKSIIDSFKNRILLLTKGSDGVELWRHGRRINIRGHTISSNDTLGTGDTFFGTFVAKFLETKDAAVAAKFAVYKAEELLKEKGGGQ